MMETAIKLNLRLFDDVINTTGSASGTGNELSHEMKTYYDSTLIKVLQVRTWYTISLHRSVRSRKMAVRQSSLENTPSSKALTPLTERVTPDGNKLDVSIVTSTREAVRRLYSPVGYAALNSD